MIECIGDWQRSKQKPLPRKHRDRTLRMWCSAAPRRLTSIREGNGRATEANDSTLSLQADERLSHERITTIYYRYSITP